MSAWTDYASEFLPALRYLYGETGLPAWLPLAMAAHESGPPGNPYYDQSTLVIEGNPWGVRPWSGSAQYGEHCGGNGCFVVYPSLLAAAQNLIVALGPQRLQYASNPVQFMDNLQATGWDYPPDGYATSVLDGYGPNAQDALAALGLDITTGKAAGSTQPPPNPGSGTTNYPSGGQPPPTTPGVNWGDVAAVAGLVLVPAAVWVASTTPWGQRELARFGLQHRALR